LWNGKERTVKTFNEFVTMIGPDVSAKIEFVCSDMWKPYLGVGARQNWPTCAFQK
jgi:transposase